MTGTIADDNHFLRKAVAQNRKEDEIYSLVPAFSFRVDFVDGVKADNVSFAEVSGIRADIPCEEVWSGGENDWVYKLPKPVKLSNLVLKKGILPHPNEFVVWCQKAIYEFEFVPATMIVSLVGGDDTMIKAWEITNAYPVRFEASSFDANKNEIVIETIELAYSKIQLYKSPETEDIDNINSKTRTK